MGPESGGKGTTPPEGLSETAVRLRHAPAPSNLEDTLHPDDAPPALPNVYFIPQSCGHVLEFRCANPCVPGDFAPLLGERCHWCSAADMQMGDVPDEFRTKWRGGAIIRKCPFTLVELKELALIEAEVQKDGPNPTPQP